MKKLAITLSLILASGMFLAAVLSFVTGPEVGDAGEKAVKIARM